MKTAVMGPSEPKRGPIPWKPRRQPNSTWSPMIRVQPKEGEPLEKTLRRLRKICNNEGVTKAVKRHSYYEKPSVRERRRVRERRPRHVLRTGSAAKPDP